MLSRIITTLNMADAASPRGTPLFSRTPTGYVCFASLPARTHGRLWRTPIRETEKWCAVMCTEGTNPLQTLYATPQNVCPVRCQDPQMQLIMPTVKHRFVANPSSLPSGTSWPASKKILLGKSCVQPESVTKGLIRPPFVFSSSSSSSPLPLLVFFNTSPCLWRTLK